MPIGARLVLVAAIVALAGAVVFAAQGGLATIARGLGSAVSGVVEDITATPTPKPTEVVVAGPPFLDAPGEPYTNQPTADLTGTIPAAFAGQEGYLVRLYVAIPDQAPVAVREVPVAATPRFQILGVQLTKGVNEFTATLVGPGGESEPSPIVGYILDTSEPRIQVSSPADGATVNAPTVLITGRTQARSSLVGRNEANGASVAASAASADGAFSLILPLEPGTNGITITVTDPAGNPASLVMSVARGSGKLTLSLSVTAFRFRISRLPDPVTVTAVVTDPDGRPLPDAVVTFTLSVPGIPTVTYQTSTNGAGEAAFQTTIPSGVTEGTGLAQALVEAGELGAATDRTVLTIVK